MNTGSQYPEEHLMQAQMAHHFGVDPSQIIKDLEGKWFVSGADEDGTVQHQIIADEIVQESATKAQQNNQQRRVNSDSEMDSGGSQRSGLSAREVANRRKRAKNRAAKKEEK